MYIEKKTLAIIALSALALLLSWASFAPPPANAETSIKDQGYQMITAKAAQGGEALYIMDNQTGLIGVFMYDPNSHRMLLRQAASVPGIFVGQ